MKVKYQFVNEMVEIEVDNDWSAVITELDRKERNLTLEEVRAVLAEKSHDGFTKEIRELLEKYGAPRLSEIDPANYAALMKDAEVLGNAT